MIYGAIRARSVRPSRHFWFGFTTTVFVYLFFSEPRLFNVPQLVLSAGEMWAQWNSHANAYERVAFHSTANILIPLVAGFVGGLVGRRLADKDGHEVER